MSAQVGLRGPNPGLQAKHSSQLLGWCGPQPAKVTFPSPQARTSPPINWISDPRAEGNLPEPSSGLVNEGVEEEIAFLFLSLPWLFYFEFE